MCGVKLDMIMARKLLLCCKEDTKQFAVKKKKKTTFFPFMGFTFSDSLSQDKRGEKLFWCLLYIFFLFCMLKQFSNTSTANGF